MGDAIIFQPAAHFDGARQAEAGIGIDQHINTLPQTRSDGGNDDLGPPLPLVTVSTAFRPDAPFRGGEALFATKARQTFRLQIRLDVAAHGTGVKPHPARPPADQRRHRLFRHPPPQIPERGIQPRQRALQIAAGVFVFHRQDVGAQFSRLGHRPAKRPGRDLAVEDRGSDVGVIGRALPPAERAILRGHPHETDEFVGKGFQPGDGEHLPLHRRVRASMREARGLA